MRAGISLTSVVAILHPALVFAQQTERPTPSPTWDWYGPGHMWGWGWGFWWMMPVAMLFFFLVCIAMAWIFFGRMWSGRSHHWGPPWHMMDRPWSHWNDATHSALNILNERYARGEIDKADYEERKATILASRGS